MTPSSWSGDPMAGRQPDLLWEMETEKEIDPQHRPREQVVPEVSRGGGGGGGGGMCFQERRAGCEEPRRQGGALPWTEPAASPRPQGQGCCVTGVLALTSHGGGRPGTST